MREICIYQKNYEFVILYFFWQKLEMEAEKRAYNEAVYRTGIETKQNIVTSAKELFYQNGYRNTSVHMICQAAHAKLGTFTYYFPKKNDLISLLYREYMQACVDYVDGKKLKVSSPEHHLIVVMLYYDHLYSDEAITRFHREVLEIASMNEWFDNPRSLIEGFSGIMAEHDDEQKYNLYVRADNAVRRELNLDFIAGEDHSPLQVKNLLHDIYTINARLFDVDFDQMEAYLKKAYRFACSNRDAEVSLL